MSRIAIIPARGGSKRIKNKNIIPFCGKPLISYPLAAARESELFDQIHVSTESDEIRSVVEGLGYPVDFMRPQELADDYTPIIPVLQWVLKAYAERGKRFDDVCLLMPTAPLLEARDLQESVKIFEPHRGKRALVAVGEYPVPVEWGFTRKEDGLLIPDRPGMFAIRSQDLPRHYYDTGAFCFYTADQILRGDTSGDYLGYILPKTKCIDIDEPEDLQLAEALFKGLRPR